MHVDQLIARVRSRIATMQTTAEEYEIEAKFHADKALDLRLGVMELNQLITSVQEFVDGEPDETPAAPRPGEVADATSVGEVEPPPSALPAPRPDISITISAKTSASAPRSEVAASDAAATSAGEVFPSASPATISAAPVSLDATTDPAKLVAEEPSSDGSGEVQDRRESTSPPDSAPAPTDETGTASSSELIPMYSRAGHIGTWVRTDQTAVDADNEEQDLVEVLAHEKAPDPAPAGGAATSPAPTVKERVKALHAQHPEYTRKQACEALGITEGSLAGHGHALGIRWAPSPASPKFKAGQPAPPPRPAVQYAPGSTGDRVRIVHEQHPTWTARLIANHLGAAEKTVANILGELRRQAKVAPPPEFTGKAELVGHYSDVAKRLGKV